MTSHTLRARMEAIKARHHAHDYLDIYDKPLPDVGCAACPYPHTWPCPDYSDAVAALELLDHSPAGSAAKFLHPRTADQDKRYALVLDPLPDPVVLASRDPQDDEQGQA